jgi:sugar phosphate isomerase/epimerase
MVSTRRGFLSLAAGGLAGLGLAARGSASPRIWFGDGPARIRLGSCAYSLRDLLTSKPPQMDLFGFLDYAHEIGLDGVELTSYYFPTEFDDSYLLSLRDRCAELELAVSGGSVGGNLTVPPEGNAETLDMVRAWLGHCRVLGAPVMRIFAGNTAKGVSEEQGRANVVASIRECLPAAEEAGVVMVLENHGGVVATPAGVMSILDGVQSPWLQSNLDTGNFHSADPYAELEQIAPYAANVHAKVYVTPAGGPPEDADWDRIVGMLTRIGYQGFISIEYEGKLPPREGVKAEADKIRAALDRAAANPA